MALDDIARRNQAFWKKMAGDQGREANRYTRPWLDLDPALLQAFVQVKVDVLPEPYTYIYPPAVFKSVRDKNVLCLAASGGQQSAVFGLLGARVTVFDLTDEQLEADRGVARHYGYDVETIQGDMRDLSGLEAGAYDMVYQAVSVCFVPDLAEVYGQVARVVRPGGVYRVEHCHPATQAVEEDTWDGSRTRRLSSSNISSAISSMGSSSAVLSSAASGTTRGICAIRAGRGRAPMITCLDSWLNTSS